MKQAKKAVKKFREIYKIKGNPTAYEIKQIIKKLGFELCGYSENEKKLCETKTQYLSGEKPAFTYVKGSKKYVFYDDFLNEADTERVLAHELGHLYYNHMHRSKTLFDTNVNKEWEANLFAALLLEPVNRKNEIIKILIVLILTMMCFATGVTYAEKKMHTDAVDMITNYVYITPNGHNYHTDNCRYGENYENSVQIKRTEAQKHYLPCSLCNPDKY